MKLILLPARLTAVILINLSLLSLASVNGPFITNRPLPLYSSVTDNKDNIPESEFFQLSFPVSTKGFKWYTGVSPNRYLDYTSIIDHNPPFYNTSTNLEPYTGEHGPTTGGGSDACGALDPSQRPYCYNGHSGLDIAVITGTPLYASHAGIVVWGRNSGYFDGYGNTVLIRDETNFAFITLYGHLSEALVNVNDHVARGQRIGTSGCTGACAGDHLHWGLYYDISGKGLPSDVQGKVLDPYGWLSMRPNPLTNPTPVPTDYKWAKGYSSQGALHEPPPLT